MQENFISTGLSRGDAYVQMERTGVGGSGRDDRGSCVGAEHGQRNAQDRAGAITDREAWRHQRTGNAEPAR
jgi:hypothetical protein